MTDNFERVIFSDIIWKDHYTKVTHTLAANNEGLKECGVICSLRKEHCPLFRFVVSDGACKLAQNTSAIDWSDKGAENTEIYVKKPYRGL